MFTGVIKDFQSDDFYEFPAPDEQCSYFTSKDNSCMMCDRLNTRDCTPCDCCCYRWSFPSPCCEPDALMSFFDDGGEF